eukprot:2712646-Pyramimonas_sp.AAC.1
MTRRPLGVTGKLRRNFRRRYRRDCYRLRPQTCPSRRRLRFGHFGPIGNHFGLARSALGDLH